MLRVSSCAQSQDVTFMSSMDSATSLRYAQNDAAGVNSTNAHTLTPHA
jgi:hypothetical protein